MDAFNLRPSAFRVEAPVFLLVISRMGADDRHVDDIEDAGFSAVFVAALVFGNSSMGQAAHGSDPRSGSTVRQDLFAGDAAPPVLPGVGEAHDPFDRGVALGSIGIDRVDHGIDRKARDLAYYIIASGME